MTSVLCESKFIYSMSASPPGSAVSYAGRTTRVRRGSANRLGWPRRGTHLVSAGPTVNRARITRARRGPAAAPGILFILLFFPFYIISMNYFFNSTFISVKLEIQMIVYNYNIIPKSVLGYNHP